MTFNRHDMLFLNDEGKSEAVENMRPLGDCARRDVDRVRRLILADGDGWPAVVRRFSPGERECGRVPIGFSSPFMSDGGRIRIASRVRAECVRESRGPYDVFVEAASGTDRLAEVLVELPTDAEDGRFGVWGSAALQAVTGRDAWGDESDVDLIVKGFTSNELRDVQGRLATMAEQFAIAFDVEVDLGEGDGVNMNELLSETETCLVKGNDEVKLVQRSRILAAL